MDRDITINDLGVAYNSNLEVNVEFDLNAAEPMVRYYPDGSGYPGCPASCEINEVFVTKYWSNNTEIFRNEKPEWFEILDKIAAAYIEKHHFGILDELLDQV